MNVALTVNGALATDLCEYALRFVGHADKALPVLYYRGRRVVSPWTLHLECDEKGSPEDANANTA